MTAPQRADLSVNGWNGQYVEALYARWQEDPDAVDPQWQEFFRGFDLGIRVPEAADGETGATSGTSSDTTVTVPALPEPSAPGGAATRGDVAATMQAQVDSLIYHYRDIGHYAADLDPLGTERTAPPELELASFGLSDTDLDQTVAPGHLPLRDPCTLREVVGLLRETYCGHVGVEYMHIQDRERRRWLQQRMEPLRNKPPFTDEQKQRILRELIEADGFETFLNTRYRGKKRFGLNGGESLIPLLDELAESGPEHGVEEYTIAMAHRGRLNVLVNILHKPYDKIFTEFNEAWGDDYIEGGGDVKYHRGYSGDFVTSFGLNIRMTLSPNPSHLEFANSVVLGRARAKQRLRHDAERIKCVPILIHGDASFPGQGIVAECFNMMHLDGYTVGGAIHVVVNNQIGFTTNPRDAHSGHYCTDLAKMVEAPIFHVNGDDPEACVFVAHLAIAYRQQFKNDVVIDMWCYREHGHNEGDEPAFTQPLMYERIKKQVPVVKKYTEQLIAEGVITQSDFDATYEQVRSAMDEAQTRTLEVPVETSVQAFRSVWSGLTQTYDDEPVETGVPRGVLETVSRSLSHVPPEFALHKKLQRLLKTRGEALENDKLDWAMGELLAYGSLLLEGHAVRLTGQDVERGTFSHRHAVLFDQKTGEGYDPLNHIAPEQAKFCIHNSPLTESACLGFEYGYSLGDPQMLIIWEAQFGDFVNGAQVIIDQFICSAETKWSRFSGLVMFLPHGYEGQGPEHSSARLERFLLLCARDDMQVVYPTTPAQFFHVLRRQMKRAFRKPLILMTPKSLLRHPQAVSPAVDLVEGRFHHVLDDPLVTDPDRIRRLLLCSGKVYYDLVAHRAKVGIDDTAIIRVEQLFPFRVASVREVLDRYPHRESITWVQEEPKNMGAYRHIDTMFRERFDIVLPYIGREANSSPAVASFRMHQQQQEAIMIRAVGLPEDEPEVAPATAATTA